MAAPAHYLLFHGSIVLVIGLLSGVPYGIAINQQKNDEVVRAWKLAHSALSLGATTMVAIAAVLSSLTVDPVVQWLLAVVFIISGYGFCFALILEPFVEDRGLAWTGRASNKVVFVGNVVGASSSLLGAIILVYASYLSLL